MKADAPKRKVFSDVLDLVDAMDGNADVKNEVQMLPIKSIQPFHNHPFHLYEGERLNDMVQSIREHGVLNPVIVRKVKGGYEMLSGHNRQNVALWQELQKSLP